jgi:CBS domain-containing protein
MTWGVISDRDLVRALADKDASLTAADIARPPVVTVEPTERLDRVAELMAAHDLSHVIVTEGVVPVGVITSLAIARAAGLQ